MAVLPPHPMSPELQAPLPQREDEGWGKLGLWVPLLCPRLSGVWAPPLWVGGGGPESWVFLQLEGWVAGPTAIAARFLCMGASVAQRQESCVLPPLMPHAALATLAVTPGSQVPLSLSPHFTSSLHSNPPTFRCVELCHILVC